MIFDISSIQGLTLLPLISCQFEESTWSLLAPGQVYARVATHGCLDISSPTSFTWNTIPHSPNTVPTDHILQKLHAFLIHSHTSLSTLPQPAHQAPPRPCPSLSTCSSTCAYPLSSASMLLGTGLDLQNALLLSSSS